MKNQIYLKANSLIKASFNMNADDYKIVNKLFFETYMAEHHEVTICADNTKIHSIKISVSKLQEEFKNKISFYELTKWLKYIKDSKSMAYRDENFLVITDIITILKINEEEKSFTIFLLDEVYKTIKNIENEYTPINLKALNSFRSIYTQRFYENFRIWSRTKKSQIYTVQELKNLMCVQQKYPRYADFNRKCIKVAIKEINESGYMDVKVEEIKNGRKVESLLFTVIDNEEK